MREIVGDDLVVPQSSIHPYLSLVILECTAPDPAAELRRLGRHMERLVRGVRGDVVVLAATRGDDDGNEGALIYRRQTSPSWAIDLPFSDVEHQLVIWGFEGRLVAINCGQLANRLQAWLDEAPIPPYRRIPAEVLKQEFLGGDVKHLWLRGSHPPKTTLPNSKNLGGSNLKDALTANDATFSLSAGRASLELSSSTSNKADTIGCDPRDSKVWVKRSGDIQEYRGMVGEILDIVSKGMARQSHSNPIPWLAEELDGLDEVHGAYEIVVTTPDELGSQTNADQDLMDAAMTLQRAELHVTPDKVGAGFLLDVGLDGVIGGSLHCSVTVRSRRTRLDFGNCGDPTYESQVRQVRNALQHTSLLTIYYESGHAVTANSICSSLLESLPFPGWNWKDVDGYDVAKEKPSKNSSEIHDLIARGGDDSLFSWVARNQTSGFLTCDDGPGEVADFIHLSQDETLSLIHVKGTAKSNPGRRISAQKYEEVVGQALKNLEHTNSVDLVNALKRNRAQASWYEGQRVPDRNDMIDFLEARSLRAKTRVVVFQPHVIFGHYEKAWNDREPRVRLLDTILNAANSTIAGRGVEFEVWGAR